MRWLLYSLSLALCTFYCALANAVTIKKHTPTHTHTHLHTQRQLSHIYVHCKLYWFLRMSWVSHTLSDITCSKQLYQLCLSMFAIPLSLSLSTPYSLSFTLSLSFYLSLSPSVCVFVCALTLLFKPYTTNIYKHYKQCIFLVYTKHLSSLY